jgi:hypothetical protein
VLPAASVTELNVRNYCILYGPEDAGTLTIMERDRSDVARISATARVDIIDPSAPATPVGFSVDGIPIGSLEGTNAAQLVMGLRSGSPGPVSYRTDCYLATFTDAANSGVVGKLRLRDRTGAALGSSLWVSLKPWELVRIEDVFAAAGVASMSSDDAQLEIGLAGANAPVLGYCLVVTTSTPEAASTFHLAKVVEPEYEARRRHVDGAGRSTSEARTASRHLRRVRGPSSPAGQQARAGLISGAWRSAGIRLSPPTLRRPTRSTVIAETESA